MEGGRQLGLNAARECGELDESGKLVDQSLGGWTRREAPKDPRGVPGCLGRARSRGRPQSPGLRPAALPGPSSARSPPRCAGGSATPSAPSPAARVSFQRPFRAFLPGSSANSSPGGGDRRSSALRPLQPSLLLEDLAPRADLLQPAERSYPASRTLGPVRLPASDDFGVPAWSREALEDQRGTCGRQSPGAGQSRVAWLKYQNIKQNPFLLFGLEKQAPEGSVLLGPFAEVPQGLRHCLPMLRIDERELPKIQGTVP